MAEVGDKRNEELKSLLVHTLEASGTLSQIRAELRASVHKAINSDEDQVGTLALPSKLTKSPVGHLMAEVVAEFFEFYDFKHSLAVLIPESSLGRERRPRAEVAADAGFAGTLSDCVSVLEQLIITAMGAKDDAADLRASAGGGGSGSGGGSAGGGGCGAGSNGGGSGLLPPWPSASSLPTMVEEDVLRLERMDQQLATMAGSSADSVMCSRSRACDGVDGAEVRSGRGSPVLCLQRARSSSSPTSSMEAAAWARAVVGGGAATSSAATSTDAVAVRSAYSPASQSPVPSPAPSPARSPSPSSSAPHLPVQMQSASTSRSCSPLARSHSNSPIVSPVDASAPLPAVVSGRLASVVSASASASASSPRASMYSAESRGGGGPPPVESEAGRHHSGLLSRGTGRSVLRLPPPRSANMAPAPHSHDDNYAESEDSEDDVSATGTGGSSTDYRGSDHGGDHDF
eukprot:NODE_4718_length_1856_cov_7.168884.p1 GENE.NODE_4718_length_1856_cov_7.168884~~NODE_4718_length_1856_cov_7.168884.p1  ORF type:complete len:459 (-),score=148.32 NODE_4718_length_1856_cov_7.168884:299-1675(-)